MSTEDIGQLGYFNPPVLQIGQRTTRTDTISNRLLVFNHSPKELFYIVLGLDFFRYVLFLVHSVSFVSAKNAIFF